MEERGERRRKGREGGMEGRRHPIQELPSPFFSLLPPPPSSVCVSVSHRRPLLSFQLEGRRREETVFVGGVLSSW